MIMPLLLPLLIGLQAPASEPRPVPMPVPVQAAATLPQVRAQYSWGYVGADGQGKGTLNVLVDPVSGRTVLELQGLGERLVLLEGSAAEGFHLQIPRQKIDQRAPTLAGLPLPFLPQVGDAAGLYRLLRDGGGPGVKVSKRDADGPIKLRYDGKDDRGREVTVWLTRTRWEPAPPK